MKPHKVFLGLGSNLGNREENLRNAIIRIRDIIGAITQESGIYETVAWGLTDQNAFLNQVIAIETSYSPIAVLHLILRIEREMGRIREVKWGARIIDIDILYYDDEMILTENLSIPHPFIQERKFVLVPLCEISPENIHPILKQTNHQLLLACQDSGEVNKVIN
ncbi:2-amino-4-hydroxy-6-hydroxymethyldihydropteridin epyrophosphokinase [Emticicia oligotrophica DSM 17448]|uniref:2-amino-4-hydroxy-6-hydroxymethyldihydropteridine pyrophosphokinase n=1 Tax=Emticicia oligotrophica (strain DSM 17448 / CIP 109782 / MTCC 6937 / GPTSA100-15) TaxID=929562 RepID=A0ABM5N175_EMTOG|nr:2-amino-4-hydroxy-6-hydroxymethyldihydropteridine diphosphokinase [Emticicia oligotrophica]AFK03160.1 2-amino-4-hydroxy-6-hydroxymethyldihydropteridin epyrophosphokinase [Emticicia oligotrophica DSM 17448]